jgi:hypothetical protein
MRIEPNQPRRGNMMSHTEFKRQISKRTDRWVNTKGKPVRLRERVQVHRDTWARQWYQLELFGKNRGARFA